MRRLLAADDAAMKIKFRVGQKVRVVRKVPADAWYADLTGVESTIAEVDAIEVMGTLIQVNYTLAAGHYVHQEELEAL